MRHVVWRQRSPSPPAVVSLSAAPPALASSQDPVSSPASASSPASVSPPAAVSSPARASSPNPVSSPAPASPPAPASSPASPPPQAFAAAASTSPPPPSAGGMEEEDEADLRYVPEPAGVPTGRPRLRLTDLVAAVRHTTSNQISAVAARLEAGYTLDSNREQLLAILVCMHAARLDVARHLREEVMRAHLHGLNAEGIIQVDFGYLDNQLTLDNLWLNLQSSEDQLDLPEQQCYCWTTALCVFKLFMLFLLIFVITLCIFVIMNVDRLVAAASGS